MYIYLLVLLQLISHIKASSNCISNLILYTETGDENNAQSDANFEFVFVYDVSGNRKLQVFTLPDRPGDDYAPNKGDYYTFGGLKDCKDAASTLVSNYCIRPAEGSTDGWLIRDAIAYGQVGDGQDFILIAHNYGTNEWVDYFAADYADVAPVIAMSVAKGNVCGQRIKAFYIMAMTSGEKSAGSDLSHQMKINDKTFTLYDRKGDDMKKNKGDLWKISVEEAGFETCLALEDVTSVSFEAAGNDGWLITEAFVSVELEDGTFTLLAGNTNINRWLDGNEQPPGESSIPLKIQHVC